MMGGRTGCARWYRSGFSLVALERQRVFSQTQVSVIISSQMSWGRFR
jgi:hypothetical protein